MLMILIFVFLHGKTIKQGVILDMLAEIKDHLAQHISVVGTLKVESLGYFLSGYGTYFWVQVIHDLRDFLNFLIFH